MNLNVDTSWYTRYRSTKNPDLGASFPQAVEINGEPAIPLSDDDTPPDMDQPIPPRTRQQRRMQAIANTAGFHFAMIEQGGSSLYTALSLKVTDLEALRVVVSIGGTEVNHFAVWHDKAGNAVSQPLAGVTDPETGVRFPDLNAPPFGGAVPDEPDHARAVRVPQQLAAAVLDHPAVADDRFAGAVAAVNALTADGLFNGQSPAFFSTPSPSLPPPPTRPRGTHELTRSLRAPIGDRRSPNATGRGLSSPSGPGQWLPGAAGQSRGGELLAARAVLNRKTDPTKGDRMRWLRPSRGTAALAVAPVALFCAMGGPAAAVTGGDFILRPDKHRQPPDGADVEWRRLAGARPSPTPERRPVRCR